VILLEAKEPPPFGPWAALGLAALFVGLALFLVYVIRRAFANDYRNLNRNKQPPPWYRIRVLGYHDLTLVPLVFSVSFFSLSLVLLAVYVWSDINFVGILGGFSAFAAVACFAWNLFDSFRPRAWRSNGKDEYSYITFR
jgi:hypothetical protein